MRIRSNADQVAKKFREAAKRLERAPVKTVRGATLAGQRFARRIAPHYSGDLIRGIQRKPIMKKGKVTSSELISSVSKPFPYHFWINEEPGYTSIRIGGRGKKRRYTSTDYDGMPRYWQLTFELLKKRYPALLQKKVGKALAMK